jgi:hypothetical protein
MKPTRCVLRRRNPRHRVIMRTLRPEAMDKIDPRIKQERKR